MTRVNRRIQDDLSDSGLGSILKSRTQRSRAEQIIFQRRVAKIMIPIHISRFGSAGFQDACQLDQPGNFVRFLASWEPGVRSQKTGVRIRN